MKKKLQRVTSLSLALALVAALFVSTTIPASALSYSGSASYKSGKYYRALTSVQLTGNQRTDIVNVAKSQVGYQEGSSSSRLSGEVRGNANCTEYGRWYGLQDMWCAMFVSWCANAAGISTSTVPKHCYTPSGLSWFKSRGLAYSRATVARGGYTPQPGDIIYFKSSRNSNTTNHIGIVTSYSGSTVYTIEGNTSSATISTNGGAVAAKSYSISNTYIVYICKPNYSGTNISTGSGSSSNTGSSVNAKAKALTFDASYYSSKYADLKSAFGTDKTKLYNHFINVGIKEGRQASPCFDVKYYLTNNADLKSAFGSNYQKAYDHYITTGYKEYHRVATAAPVNLGNDFKANISFSSKNLSLSGDNVILYTPSSAPAQIWRFIRQSDGSYKIVNTKNNKCLDANGATDNAGANVSLYNDNGSRAQRWFIYSKNGKYILRPGCARLTVLDVNGGSTNNSTNIQQYTYNDSNAQMFSITKVVAETAAPTISNVKVSDVTAAGYKVTCTVSSPFGIKEVKFPTWTSNNGQDDIKWHVATISGNTASYYVNVKDHKNESGRYETHIYVYDKAGKEAKATTSATVPAAAKPTISNVKVSDVTAAGYKVTCTVSSPFGIKEVKFPTWTSNNGQDDIKWHVATISGNTASYYVNVKDHKNESGRYETHIYVYDKAGKEAKATTSATVPTNALSQMTAVNLGDDFCARISFATANKNLSLNGVNVITFSPSKKPAQVWRFKRNTDNSYTIINEKTGNCLDVSGAASTAGTNVATYKSNNSSAQRWYLYLVDGKYVFRPACSKECVLDVATGSTKDYANLQIYTYNASNAQKFTITKIGTYISEVDPENLGDISTCITFPTCNKNLSISNGNVILYQKSTSDAQVWNFKRQSDGSYKIVNKKYGTCLDVSGAANKDGTNVALYKDNGSAAQRWFVYLKEGKYILRPACSSTRVLDVNGGRTADLTNIQLWTYAGVDNTNKEFYFTSPSSSTSTGTSTNTSGTATASQMAVMRKIIYAVETGGQVYGNVDYSNFTEAYTNSSSEHAITIGGGQWYGNEAKRLLNTIRATNPVTFASLDTAGIASDLDTQNWSTYKLSKTSAKAKCIQKIIGSSVGIKCQDQLLDEQMAAYMQEAKNLGVTDIAAQMMCANFRHQGGLSAMKRIINKTATPYTLDNLYAACQTDTGNQVGAYKSRQKMVYNALKTYL